MKFGIIRYAIGAEGDNKHDIYFSDGRLSMWVPTFKLASISINLGSTYQSQTYNQIESW